MNMAEMKQIAQIEAGNDVEGVPLAMHKALEMWGRWNRGRGNAAATVQSQLKAYRDNRCPACYESEPCEACKLLAPTGLRIAADVPPIQVEKAMLQLAEKPRELLRAHYYRGVNPHITSRVLGFPYRSYRDQLRSAALMVRNLLVRDGVKVVG